MTRMVEKVMAAIWDAEKVKTAWNTNIDFVQLPKGQQDEFRLIARAAIKALSEPNEAMQTAGLEALVSSLKNRLDTLPVTDPKRTAIRDVLVGTITRESPEITATWRAMIREALKDNTA